MLKCIALFLMMVPTQAQELQREYTATFYQVVKNHPNIDKEYAYRIANAIDKASLELNIDPKKLAAILAQESMYVLNAVNKKSKDYGIAQINHKTLEWYGFDKKRLLTDLEYSVKCGAIVLADFKRRYGKKEKTYWSRYNSSNPERRKEYEILVARYF